MFWFLVFVDSFVSETGSGSHQVALAGLTGYVDPSSSEFMEILLLLSSECWHYRLRFVLLGHESHYIAQVGLPQPLSVGISGKCHHTNTMTWDLTGSTRQLILFCFTFTCHPRPGLNPLS